VRRCRPDAALIEAHCHNGERAMTYVWAVDEANHAEVRFFFPKNGAPCEDPGTGSACANLGGYLLARGDALPLHWTLSQGTQINKACTLTLNIDTSRQIYVGGRVVELGRGEINLPD
jgi:trans-2,3-dihydro-3-hydroxyanthranilate isomerase